MRERKRVIAKRRLQHVVKYCHTQLRLSSLVFARPTKREGRLSFDIVLCCCCFLRKQPTEFDTLDLNESIKAAAAAAGGSSDNKSAPTLYTNQHWCSPISNAFKQAPASCKLPIDLDVDVDVDAGAGAGAGAVRPPALAAIIVESTLARPLVIIAVSISPDLSIYLSVHRDGQMKYLRKL